MPEGIKKTCFVVMGFHKKTDYQTDPPRTLDLDKSYQHLIKPAVEAAGLECIRADEIQHSGVIDVPMYEQLLSADVVVADLSTANPNALYELGVRHALRPYTTIVIAEDQLKYPFDINHTVIRGYRHLGEDIGFGEAERFQKLLKDAIEELIKKTSTDSPVYTYLSDLDAPKRAGQQGSGDEIQLPPPDTAQPTLAALVAEVEKAKGKGNFGEAKVLLKILSDKKPNDPYYIQQLALATYKSKIPSPKEALLEAREILSNLHPSSSTDPETLGLWGAVHKRLWEETKDLDYLSESILGYEKGFYVKNDYYNGINLAFMLDTRASASEGNDKIADHVLAGRIRRRVIEICEELIKKTEETGEEPDYWILATLEEAYHALDEKEETMKWRQKAENAAKQTWMREATLEQIAKLNKLLNLK